MKRLFLRLWKYVQVFLQPETQRSDINPRSPTDDILEDIAWIFPPKDVHNADAWDSYWKKQIEHGFGPAFFDMFIRDDIIVKAAQRFGLSTVLCVGNGISQEPVALSRAGLRVTAMDISPLAISLCQAFSEKFHSEDHYISPSLLLPDGTVNFVVGDILNRYDCPGPYDIVIERRTIQDYPEDQRREAVAAIISRISTRGILVSHCHDGAWKPPAEPYHSTRSLIAGLGIEIWKGGDITNLDGRIALTLTSTG